MKWLSAVTKFFQNIALYYCKQSQSFRSHRTIYLAMFGGIVLLLVSGTASFADESGTIYLSETSSWHSTQGDAEAEVSTLILAAIDAAKSNIEADGAIVAGSVDFAISHEESEQNNSPIFKATASSEIDWVKYDEDDFNAESFLIDYDPPNSLNYYSSGSVNFRNKVMSRLNLNPICVKVYCIAASSLRFWFVLGGKFFGKE